MTLSSQPTTGAYVAFTGTWGGGADQLREHALRILATDWQYRLPQAGHRLTDCQVPGAADGWTPASI